MREDDSSLSSSGSGESASGQQEPKRHHLHVSPPVAHLPIPPDMAWLKNCIETTAFAQSSESRRQHEETRRLNEQALRDIRIARENDLARVTQVEERVAAVESRTDTVQAVLEAVQDLAGRSARALDLTVRGFPLNGNETRPVLREYVGRLGKALGVELDERNLVDVFRTKPRKSSADAMVIMKFSDAGIRNLFFQRYFENNGLDTSELGFLTKSRIFISDNLTPTNAYVRGRAAGFKKEGVIQNFSVRDGIVRVRLSADAPYLPVRSAADLDTLVRTGKLPPRPRLQAIHSPISPISPILPVDPAVEMGVSLSAFKITP